MRSQTASTERSHSQAFDRAGDADLIEQAIWNALSKGIRTADIAGDFEPVSTSAMGDAVLAELDALNR